MAVQHGQFCYSIHHDFKFICIRPTGGGKSLLYKVLALYVKGVTLCITPILALGADQMRKVLQMPDRSVTAFHMDKLNDAHVLKLKRNLEIELSSKTKSLCDLIHLVSSIYGIYRMNGCPSDHEGMMSVADKLPAQRHSQRLSHDDEPKLERISNAYSTTHSKISLQLLYIYAISY